MRWLVIATLILAVVGCEAPANGFDFLVGNWVIPIPLEASRLDA